MTLPLSEQTVLITGAGRGLGAAIARAFAREGAQVAINYHNSRDAAEALDAELGPRAAAFQADVTDADQVTQMVAAIQELAYGGLKPETIRRLERLGEELDGGDRKKSRIRADMMPITGTRLLREWQGVEHVVTVTTDGFEWQGRPYKSLSAIARAITGTRWNGWVFFGLRNRRRKA